jgi:hypothetical protein
LVAGPGEELATPRDVEKPRNYPCSDLTEPGGDLGLGYNSSHVHLSIFILISEVSPYQETIFNQSTLWVVNSDIINIPKTADMLP